MLAGSFSSEIKFPSCPLGHAPLQNRRLLPDQNGIASLTDPFNSTGKPSMLLFQSATDILGIPEPSGPHEIRIENLLFPGSRRAASTKESSRPTYNL